MVAKVIVRVGSPTPRYSNFNFNIFSTTLYISVIFYVLIHLSLYTHHSYLINSKTDIYSFTMDFSKVPKAGKLTAGKSAAFMKILTDQESLNLIDEEATQSIYYDSSSKSSRDRREMTRNEFEEFVKMRYNVTHLLEIWNAETFIERCIKYFSAMTLILLEQRKGKQNNSFRSYCCIFD
jgi:hypothetical protein